MSALEFKSKKVEFHKLTFINKENQSVFEDIHMQDFFDWLMDQEESLRIKPLGMYRTCSLDLLEVVDKSPTGNIDSYNGAWFGMFSSSAGGSKRDMRHISTGKKKKNPNTIEEGEEVRNFFTLTEPKKGVFSLNYQVNFRGLPADYFSDYLTMMLRNYIVQHGGNDELEFTIEQKTELTTTDKLLNLMERVTRTEVTLSSEILSDELGLVESIEDTRDTVTLELKAHERQSMKSMTEELLKNKQQKKITKVYIVGRDYNKGEMKFWVDDAKRHVKIKFVIDPNTKGLVIDAARSTLLNIIE